VPPSSNPANALLAHIMQSVLCTHADSNAVLVLCPEREREIFVTHAPCTYHTRLWWQGEGLTLGIDCPTGRVTTLHCVVEYEVVLYRVPGENSEDLAL
jgi:hypothetical protein